jgi:hypothetical protein
VDPHKRIKLFVGPVAPDLYTFKKGGIINERSHAKGSKISTC